MIHLPTTAWFTVNRACNLRCRWCYAAGTNYTVDQHMSDSLAKRLLGIGLGLGIKDIIIIGGEPTLWPGLCDFNDDCRARGVGTVLVTNGIRFSQDRFWAKYQDHPSDRIGLSLKAANRKQLIDVAGYRNFQSLKKGLVRAATMKAGLSITYNSFYIGKLVDLVTFAVDCGFKNVKLDFCSVTFQDGKPSASYMVPPIQLAQEVMDVYPQLNAITKGAIVFEMMVPFCIWPAEFVTTLIEKRQILSVCHVHKRAGIIFDVDGSVIACNALFDYPIGHLDREYHDSATLRDLLSSERVVGYYRALNCYPSLECRDCEHYNVCGGGCPLRWAVYRPEQIVRPFPSPSKGEHSHGSTPSVAQSLVR